MTSQSQHQICLHEVLVIGTLIRNIFLVVVICARCWVLGYFQLRLGICFLGGWIEIHRIGGGLEKLCFFNPAAWCGVFLRLIKLGAFSNICHKSLAWARNGRPLVYEKNVGGNYQELSTKVVQIKNLWPLSTWSLCWMTNSIRRYPFQEWKNSWKNLCVELLRVFDGLPWVHLFDRFRTNIFGAIFSIKKYKKNLGKFKGYRPCRRPQQFGGGGQRGSHAWLSISSQTVKPRAGD